MIEAYCGSPTQIDKVDFAKVGTGTGVMRYAFGMHFGERNTAEYYLHQYKDYNAAELQFRLKDREMYIPPNSPGYKAATFLSECNFDYDKATEHFQGDKSMMTALKVLSPDEGRTFIFDVERGHLYKTKILGLNERDLTHWDDDISLDSCLDIAEAFHNQNMDRSTIKSVDWESLNLTVEQAHEMTFSELSDTLFDNALEEADENGRDEYHLEEPLREIWDALVRGDSYSIHHDQDTFDEALPEKYIAALKTLMKGNSLALEPDITHGTAYGNVSSAYEKIHAPDFPEMNREQQEIIGKRFGSTFFADVMKVPGFRAQAMFGRHGAEEIIIMDERLLQDAKFTSMDRNMEYDEPTLDFEEEIHDTPEQQVTMRRRF